MASRSLRILIADDCDGFSDVLTRFLRSDGLADTVWRAETGEKAVQVAASEHPDVVLMDLSMPGIGGVEATRRIKAALPDMPVIVLTAHDDAQHRTWASSVAADAFLPKSDVVEQLHGLVIACSNQPSSH